MKIRSDDHSADISAINIAGGNINQAFSDFYSTLYKSEVQLDMVRCGFFLRQLNLPQLTMDDSLNLDHPITPEELQEAPLSMQTNKSPGIDGIPPEVYLSFWEKLGPLLLEMIRASAERGTFSRDVNTALVSLLLKKDKDPMDCASYRPLSLLNSDLKIYATNCWTYSMVYALFSPFDQTGIIKTKLASDDAEQIT